MQDTLESYITESRISLDSGTSKTKSLDKKATLKQHEKSKTHFHHKKSLGQHFLHDSIILDRIFQSIPQDIAAEIDKSVRLIEVGIGLGDLTKRLLSKYSLLAYEIDYDLITQAEKNYHHEIETNRLQLVQADVLKVRHNNSYLLSSDYFLVSNLPYYIATAIILQALKDTHCKGFLVMTQKEVAQKFCAKQKDSTYCSLSLLAQSFGDISYLFSVPKHCKGFLVMTQKEVAQKFCAKQKDSTYCSLSLLAQSFGDISYLFSVPKEAFNPPPKVESAVFCFKRGECHYTQDLESLLHFAFLAPRKKLFSNLMQWDKMKDKAMLKHIFQTMRLDENIRAHEVGLQEYCNMLHIYNAIKKDKQ